MLQALQSLIAGIYDVPLTHNVTDFLITDCDRLPDIFRKNGTDEQVLVREDKSTLWMTLYLERGVLERLASANPLEALHSGNVADYWTALEGVSHFVCVAWHAVHDQTVTMLELELQGEIDKYVTTFWLLKQQDPKRFPAELHNILFERTRVDALLAGDQMELYRQANAYAARFCRRLAELLRTREPSANTTAVVELRRFYRLNRERKIHHIESGFQRRA